MIKAVFFDVGGVLVRDDSDQITARQAKILGVSHQRHQEAVRLQRGLLWKGLISRREYLRRLCTALGRPLIGDRELRTIFPKQIYRYERNWKIAERLGKAGYTVGVITNDVPPHRFRPKVPLRYPPFRPVIRSYEVRARKPERRIFALALRRASVRPAEAVFFDDKPKNVVAAKRLGIKAFVYKNPAKLVRQLRRHGVKV